jgi:hypothetical protein
LGINENEICFSESGLTDILDSSAGLSSKNEHDESKMSGVSPFFSAEDINVDLSNNNVRIVTATIDVSHLISISECVSIKISFSRARYRLITRAIHLRQAAVSRSTVTPSTGTKKM